MAPSNNDDDKDLTRIEDLPPLDHPPLPKLPTSFPENFNPPDQLPIMPPPDVSPHEQQLLEIENNNFIAPETLQEEIQEDNKQKNTFEKVTDFTLPKIETQEPIDTKINDSAKFFSDVKDELETFVVKHVPFESYPSYSILVKEIKSNLHKRDIQLILKEFGLLQSETEKNLIERSLSLGHLLIPRISEYAAIFFANKFELLNLSIEYGPSIDFNPEGLQNNDLWDRGPMTGASFHHHHEEGEILEQKNSKIFFSKLTVLPGHEIQMLGQIFHQTLNIDQSLFQELQESDLSALTEHLQFLSEQAQSIKANAILNLDIKVLSDRKNQVQLLITGEAAIIHEKH